MDDELIRAARAGETHAGPFLVSLYAPRILGHTRAVAGDLGDAACEQIAECAIERAVRKIHLFDPERGSFEAWVRSMVRYTALDFRRDARRLDRLDDLDDLAAAQAAEPRRALSGEARTALQEAVRSLSKADQAILALIAYERVPPQSAADRLGISYEAVRQRYSRATRRLAAAAADDHRLLEFLKGGPA